MEAPYLIRKPPNDAASFFRYITLNKLAADNNETMIKVETVDLATPKVCPDCLG